MRKILAKKTWLCADDAAEYLSDLLDEKVCVADILELALENELTLYWKTNGLRVCDILGPALDNKFLDIFEFSNPYSCWDVLKLDPTDPDMRKRINSIIKHQRHGEGDRTSEQQTGLLPARYFFQKEDDTLVRPLGENKFITMEEHEAIELKEQQNNRDMMDGVDLTFPNIVDIWEDAFGPSPLPRIEDLVFHRQELESTGHNENNAKNINLRTKEDRLLVALGIMAWTLQKRSPVFTRGDKPNANQIKERVISAADDLGIDSTGLSNLNQDITRAIKHLESEL